MISNRFLLRRARGPTLWTYNEPDPDSRRMQRLVFYADIDVCIHVPGFDTREPYLSIPTHVFLATDAPERMKDIDPCMLRRVPSIRIVDYESYRDALFYSINRERKIDFSIVHVTQHDREKTALLEQLLRTMHIHSDSASIRGWKESTRNAIPSHCTQKPCTLVKG